MKLVAETNRENNISMRRTRTDKTWAHAGSDRKRKQRELTETTLTHMYGGRTDTAIHVCMVFSAFLNVIKEQYMKRICFQPNVQPSSRRGKFRSVFASAAYQSVTSALIKVYWAARARCSCGGTRHQWRHRSNRSVNIGIFISPVHPITCQVGRVDGRLGEGIIFRYSCALSIHCCVSRHWK